MPSKTIDVTKLTEEQRTLLLALRDQVELEDEFVRLQHMRLFKKNNLFWHGFQYLFWSEVDNDWRIPTHEQFADFENRGGDDADFRFVVNIFKSHGESIIAALSADIPDVRFGPRDADDPDDRRAVIAADNAVELIERWNRAKLLIINALFYLCTEGFCASYTYNKKDATYGTTSIPKMGKRMEQTGPDMASCGSCGYNAPAADLDDQSGTGQNVHNANDPCPQCQQPLGIEPGEQEMVPFLEGTRIVPKGREVIEIYGALNVRMSAAVTKQADAGFLIHYVDAHPALFKEAFPSVAEDIDIDSGQDYERMMRQSSLSMDGFQSGAMLTTQKRCWFRPWMLRSLDKGHDAEVGEIRKMCGTGIYASFIGDTICELRDESMDKHWSITKAGPSKGIHADPLLQALVPLQEMTNTLENLLMMQVEYGVPASYADTEVFDFEGQSRMETSPGYVYPVTPRPGQKIAEAFHQERTATLSGEAVELRRSIDQDAQFVTGDFPSVHGAPSVGGSKTLGEYDKSRVFALQRLSLVWYFINVWWGETLHKSLLSFIDHQIEDEPLTSATGAGQFQTKWVRMADLKGSFDRLEPETSADFPTTFSQKRSLIMNLLQLGNEQLNSVLLSPDNAEVMQSYAGLPELKIPDAIQKNKQMREILQLIGMDPLDSMEGPMSSVPVEPDIDDHGVHIMILTNFLCGDIGQDLKGSNPGAYANCLAHLVEHKMAMAPPMGMPGMVPPPGPPGAGAPSPGGMPGPPGSNPPKPPTGVPAHAA